MESLYTKLHDKYTELKTRKDSEMEQFNREQEEKFLNYVSAAEEHIEHLKNANKGLQRKIDELTNQIVSDRSYKDSQYAECQNLLIEERQKSKELSEEVEKLQNLISERLQCSNNNENNVDGQLTSPFRSQVNSRDFSKDSARRIALKPSSRDQVEKACVIPTESSQQVHAMAKEPEQGLIKGTPPNGALEKLHLPSCCGRDSESSGDGVSDSCHTNCIFQTLMEFLVGMKFSIVDHTEGLCLSILHQMSGYSFTLTRVTNADGQELLYHVLSLGTFERVAPEWMREDLMFSMSMCAVFFQRVSQITRLHS